MTDLWDRPDGSGHAKIAYVDDCAESGGDFANGLRRLGYSVAHFTDADEAAQSFQQVVPDIALLASVMQRGNGLKVMEALHAQQAVPVIMLSERYDETGHVRALRAGADDFVPKTVTMQLLNARITALLRRRSPDVTEVETQPQALERGELAIMPELHAAQWNGIHLRLTTTEFAILQALAEKPGYVRSRGYLKTVAYGEHERVNDRTIDSHIKRLRAKLRKVGGDNLPIDTVYGLGYRFRMNAKADLETA